MLGVKAGLGWYLQWAQGWAAYGNMWAGSQWGGPAVSAMGCLFQRIFGMPRSSSRRLLKRQDLCRGG
jgi:hypothetical protein